MVNEKKTINKRGLVFIILFGLLLISSLFINWGVSRIATQRINTLLSTESTSLYIVKVHKVKARVLRGSVKIESIHIHPRSLLTSDSIAGLYSGTIRKVGIYNVRYLKYLFKRKVKIESVIMKGMDLTYLPNPNHVKPKRKRNRTKKSIFNDKLKSVEVKEFSISQGSYTIVNSSSKSDTTWHVHNFGVELDKVRADSSSIKNDLPLLFDDLRVYGEGIRSTKPENYILTADKVRFDAAEQILKCNGFSFTPKYDRNAFSKALEYENDMFNISLQSFAVKGLDITEAFSEKHLFIDSITVQSPQVSIYRDKRVVDGPYKHKPLITSMVRKIPIPIRVSDIDIKGGRLSYEEKQDNSNPPGMIFFDLHEITIANVSNLTSEIDAEPIMKLDAKANIMGKGRLNAHFDFKLKCANDSFALKGTLDEMAASAFNPMAKNLLNVEITNGTIEKATFELGGTDDKSVGKLHLDYSNLQVDVNSQSNKHNGFMTFLANNVMDHNNLPDKGKYKTGYIYFERDKNKGFPNYLWKSILSGIKPIVAPISAGPEQKKMKHLAKP